MAVALAMNLSSDSNDLIRALSDADAYDHPIPDRVEVIETHISWVLLAGEFAYKIKKPIRNSFLDYSTLAARHRHCLEELEQNRRFAADIYLDVVPITRHASGVRCYGKGEPIEFAVRMRRFPADHLLSQRLTQGLVDYNEVRTLAARIASFHRTAEPAEVDSRFGSPDLIFAEALDNCRELQASHVARWLSPVESIEGWTRKTFEALREQFQLRRRQEHIRLCHGDLHLGNIVWWKGEYIPFDGIEFCDEFRWIDTLSDAAFTAMDLAVHGRMDYSHSFCNALFEATGDYAAASIWQWYLVYRCMVRAKVASLRAAQSVSANDQIEVQDSAAAEVDTLLWMAERFINPNATGHHLSITYGVSGSGKTTGTEILVQKTGAIRLRADVERKRINGISSHHRAFAADEIYSEEMTRATYQRLAELAEVVLRSGFSVIIDATCLFRWQRQLFQELAARLQIPFRILAFHADAIELRRRIESRLAQGGDASDADLHVLAEQLNRQEHLQPEELPYALGQ